MPRIFRRRYFKEHVFQHVVEPHLSNFCSVWGCCGDSKLNTSQKLQNMAARIIMSRSFHSSAAPLLQGSVWHSVDRLVHRWTSNMVCKSLDELAPDNLWYISSRLPDVHNRVLWSTKCDLAIPRLRTAYGQKSFAFRRADTWNRPILISN